MEFYDAIIIVGYPLGKGKVGTLGELAPVRPPWLYSETAIVGLNIPFERRHKLQARKYRFKMFTIIKLTFAKRQDITMLESDSSGLMVFALKRIV